MLVCLFKLVANACILIILWRSISFFGEYPQVLK